ncbi:MAG: YicC/YloC family endoribonuclease [Nitrospinales bacterium]
MVKSMTGYGRFENQNGDFSYKAEIRSVNNRFIEINARIPRNLASLELPLKKLIKKLCARGSFDLTVTLGKTTGLNETQEIKPNLELASQYYNALKEIKDSVGATGDIDVSALLAWKDIIKIEPVELDPEMEESIFTTVEKALSDLITMRIEEGKNLENEILGRLDEIEIHTQAIQSRQPQILQEYKNKLQERIKTLSEGVELDELRLTQETALMADRCDVTEEIIRLASHIQQFRKLLKKDEPLGRKLEFITQELNRETNTIGSKAADYQVSQSVIEMKTCLEKIREQLANIE